MTELELIDPPLAPTRLDLPIYPGQVPAGFPSPAAEYAEDVLDLNDWLVRNPTATLLARAKQGCYSMRDAGIEPGDVLVVDRSVQPADRDIVVAVMDGELTVKYLRLNQGRPYLEAANPDHPPIARNRPFEVWGVVVSWARRAPSHRPRA